MPFMAQYKKKEWIMQRIELIRQIIKRKKQLGITIENLAKLSGVSIRTINRLLKNEDVKLSTVEAVTNLLGLDFAGNEIVSIDKLKKQRAKEKALYLASIVQATSTLEKQGLEEEGINKIVSMYENEFLYGDYRNRLWIA